MSKHSAKKTSRVIIVGLDPTLKSGEARLISSICKLSKTKAKTQTAGANAQFQFVVLSETADVDIVIVNGRHHKQSKVATWVMLAKNRELPLVSISPKPLPLKLPTYRSIHPAKLGVSLLRTLNDLSETIAAHSTHVLVIDDSQLIREFMSMILEPLNVRVTLAEDGETGILRAKERPFDLIFLDVMMPEMDGYATCKALKQDPRTANVPVIMLTSKSSPFNKIKGSMSGCNRYLTKPVDNNKVVAVVDEFCGPGRKTS